MHKLLKRQNQKIEATEVFLLLCAEIANLLTLKLNRQLLRNF